MCFENQLQEISYLRGHRNHLSLCKLYTAARQTAEASLTKLHLPPEFPLTAPWGIAKVKETALKNYSLPKYLIEIDFSNNVTLIGHQLVTRKVINIYSEKGIFKGKPQFLFLCNPHPKSCTLGVCITFP